MAADALQALERLGSTCLVNLTETEVRFSMTRFALESRFSLIRVACRRSEFTNGEQAFCDMPVVRGCRDHERSWLIAALQASIFENYRIESKNNNQIPFIVNIANFVRSLKVATCLRAATVVLTVVRAAQSGEQASKIVLKLTKKKERACLTFEIETGACAPISCSDTSSKRNRRRYPSFQARCA
jgi:hypothetical protein